MMMMHVTFIYLFILHVSYTVVRSSDVTNNRCNSDSKDNDYVYRIYKKLLQKLRKKL